MHDIYPTLLPKSLMGKAITYTFSLYVRLVRYVVVGRYHIDNNAVENTIRPLALGRKNYLFCGNDEAAKDTALFYSFLGSCKDIDVTPAQWLADVSDKVKDCKVSASCINSFPTTGKKTEIKYNPQPYLSTRWHLPYGKSTTLLR